MRDSNGIYPSLVGFQHDGSGMSDDSSAFCVIEGQHTCDTLVVPVRFEILVSSAYLAAKHYVVNRIFQRISQIMESATHS